MDGDARRSPASVLLLLRLGEEHGARPADLLEGTGLTAAELVEPGREVTGRQELQVLRALQRATEGADALAVALQAGTRYHLTTYGIWGFALASSPTVRSAVGVGARFVDLSFTFCELVVEEDEDELRLVLDDRAVPEDVRGFVAVRDLAGLRTIVREAFGAAMPLTRLELRVEGPVDEAAFAEVFGVPPRLGADRNLAALDSAVLDLPLPQADPVTAAMTERQCQEVLQRRTARAGWARLVRDELLRSPGDMADVEGVAGALHVSARTLRRRLAEEGTSLRALVGEVREALAEELLATGLPVEQVARRLGYAETASFTHAFTRWKGVPPRTFARRALPRT